MIAVESMFCNLSSQEVAEFIRSAQVSVCYASPGVQTEVAKAMAEVAGRLGPEMLSVSPGEVRSDDTMLSMREDIRWLG